MTVERNSQYPFDLAKLVAANLRNACGTAPPESVLVRLLETLYFASLRTDEGRRPLCTVNFVEAGAPEGGAPKVATANRWTAVPFATPLPLDVRTLTKLARAADPEASSLNVFADAEGSLFIWGMVDQEPRHGDQIVLQADSDSHRPGLFQATITGAGSVSVFHHGVLWGNLTQHVLVDAHYDVLWTGPVHTLLAEYLRAYVAEHHPELLAECGSPNPERLDRELLLRWLNSLSRLLVNVQHYRHGGGLVIVPSPTDSRAQTKYRIEYDRLVRSVIGLARAHLLRQQSLTAVMDADRVEGSAGLRAPLAYLRNVQGELEQRKAEILGCLRFIAALSCVDGVVLLDKNLGVRGFGVELRPEGYLDEVFMAGDALAEPSRLRRVDITQFGTRHRAMMRYCHQHPGSLGFAISQDGGIQAFMRIGDRLVLWENIDVALAFDVDDFSAASPRLFPVLRWLSMRADK